MSDYYERKFEPLYKRQQISNPHQHCPKCENLNGTYDIRYAAKGHRVELFRNTSMSTTFVTETEGFICDCPVCKFEWWEYLEDQSA